MIKKNNELDCATCNHETVIRPEKLNRDLIIRLNRIEGQIKGIKGMVEKDVYCDDILTQVSAAQSALSSVSKLILESHMKTCVAEKLKNGDNDVVEEFIKTVGRLL